MDKTLLFSVSPQAPKPASPYAPMPKIPIFAPMSTTVQLVAEAGESLLSALRRKGVFVTAPCGGKGICGKCTVEVEGVGWVKACGFYPDKDIRVTVPEVSPMLILTESFWPDPEPALDSFAPGTIQDLGLAIDLGTTTVVVFLEDLQHHRNLGIRSFPNPQQAYGADVISRIHYAAEHTTGTRKLQNSILESIAEAGLFMCHELGVDPQRIGRIVIAGNTTMQHLVKGANPKSLATFPFRPVFLEEQEIPGLFSGFKQARVELIPSLASYIGADIVAGFAAISLQKNQGWNLFLDIGTNGEMVLWNKDRILTCATAAGPAFEGARISCGMPGVEGAIRKINPDGSYETIGDKPPAGLCGSGLVDAVALFLDNETIDTTGYMAEPSCVTNHASHVDNAPCLLSLTPQDVRELQLAKGAIAAGVEILMIEAGISTENIERVFLAGGFGYALHDWSSARIGLIPPMLEKRLIRAGNTSGLGARLWLHSKEFRDHTRNLVTRMEYVELSDHPEFNDRFVMNIGFV